MPEDVAFVAKNVRANVRELEGARCARCWPTAASPIRTSHRPGAREALKDLLSIQNRQVSVENIQKTVADFYKIKVADMYSKAPGLEHRAAAPDRDVPVQEMTKKSLPEIGELFGGRDHTVLHAVRKIGEERQRNPN